MHDQQHRVVPSPTLGELIGLLYRVGAAEWRTLAAAATVARPTVVCDATGEVDVLAATPDLVLDGLQLVGAAVGARRVRLCASPGIGAVAARRALAVRNYRIRTVVANRAQLGDIVFNATACARLAEVVRSTAGAVEMAP